MIARRWLLDGMTGSGDSVAQGVGLRLARPDGNIIGLDKLKSAKALGLTIPQSLLCVPTR